MKNLRKVLIVVVMCVFVMGMNMSNLFMERKISNLKFEIENCNVSIIKSEDKKISYSYDVSKFDVDRTTDESTTVITAKLKKDVLAELTDRVIIYVPDKEYSKIVVEGVSAGISLPELNSDFEVTNIDCALTFKMVSGYNKSFNCKISDSAGKLEIDPDAKDYAISLNITDSSLSVPNIFTSYDEHKNTYQHTNGRGLAQFNFTIVDSAFKIECEE